VRTSEFGKERDLNLREKGRSKESSLLSERLKGAETGEQPQD